MELFVFNVGHGSCSYLIGDRDRSNRANVALFDCGHDDESGFRPSTFLANRGVSPLEHLFVSHYDQDHVSDLPNLRRLGTRLPILSLWRNKSLTPDQIERLKRRAGPLEPGVTEIVAMVRQYSSGVTPEDRATRALAGVEWRVFYNDYPTFQDTNNLSMVTFIHHRDVSIVLPGDLETAGWNALLANPSFCEHLKRVRVFVASHHGRSNGYAEAVFTYCKPDIVIISDTKKQYGTQEQRYDQHAKGIPFSGGATRRVLSTRHDGHIYLWTKPEGGYSIKTKMALGH